MLRNPSIDIVQRHFYSQYELNVICISIEESTIGISYRLREVCWFNLCLFDHQCIDTMVVQESINSPIALDLIIICFLYDRLVFSVYRKWVQ